MDVLVEDEWLLIDELGELLVLRAAASAASERHAQLSHRWQPALNDEAGRLAPNGPRVGFAELRPSKNGSFQSRRQFRNVAWVLSMRFMDDLNRFVRFCPLFRQSSSLSIESKTN